MKLLHRSDTTFILVYFFTLIIIGTIVLSTSTAWGGSQEFPERIQPIDAFFTATSAVCVTGLITVNTAEFSRFGQIVILLLIQFGGLGIISFTSLVLIIPGRRLPFRRLRTIRSFSVGGVEHDPIKIIRSIIIFTCAIELIGAAYLYVHFTGTTVPNRAFTAIFHAVSAFCNAGFSIFPDSLESFLHQPRLLLGISLLIICGGIGFIVMHDVASRLLGKSKRLSYHSKLILIASLVLIILGAGAFLLLEGDHALAELSFSQRLSNAFFQAITPRTAGFNTIPQSDLQQASKLLTMILMFIGGAPGSIAGGIKIATAYLVLLVMLKKSNERGEINAFGRRINPETSNEAVVYFIKAIFLVLSAIVALSLIEGPRGADLGSIAFEAISAFATVGLSLDFTARLSVAGKLIIIFLMIVGRIGLFTLVYLAGSSRKEKYVYPKAEILVG